MYSRMSFNMYSFWVGMGCGDRCVQLDVVYVFILGGNWVESGVLVLYSRMSFTCTVYVLILGADQLRE